MPAAWLLFRTLNLAYFGRRPTRIALSVVGIALGVSLVLAILVLHTSLAESYAELNRQVHGAADIEISANARAGVPITVSDGIRSVEGVATAAPLLRGPAQLRGERGTQQVVAIGADARLEELAAGIVRRDQLRRIRTGEGLVVTEQLLTDLGELPDGKMILLTEVGELRLPVVAALPSDLGARLNGGRLVVVALPLAQHAFAAGGRASSVFVRVSDPARIDAVLHELRRTIGAGLLVLRTADRLAEFERSTLPVRSFTGLMSVVALVVGSYLVFITMSMAVAERRREFAILLVLGESGRQVMLRFLAEAGLIGGIGATLGALGGHLLGQQLVRSVPRYLEDAYSFETTFFAPASIYGLACSVGVAAALAAAAPAADSLLRIPAVEALLAQPPGEIPPSSRLGLAATTFGAVCLGAAVGVALVAPEMGVLAIAIGLVGVVFASPAVFSTVVRFASAVGVRYPLRIGGGLVQLVSLGLVHTRRRTVATITAAAFSFGAVIGVAGVANDLDSSLTRFATMFANMDFFVSATDDAYASVPLEDSLRSRLLAEPGVAAVYEFRNTFIVWRGRRIWLTAQDPDALRQLGFRFASGDPQGALSRLPDGGVLVSTQISRLHDVHEGDVVTIETPTGPRGFPVLGVVEHWAWPEGTMIVGTPAFVSSFEQPAVNQFLVRLVPGASKSVFRDRLGETHGSLRIVDGPALMSQIRSTQTAQLAPFFQMRNVAVLVAVLALLNTMLIAVLQRFREFGVLRAIGLFPSEVGGAVVIEAVVMVMIALVAAVALGFTLHIFALRLLVAVTGLPVDWTAQFGTVAEGVVAAVVTALVGAVYPAWHAARLPVLAAISYE